MPALMESSMLAREAPFQEDYWADAAILTLVDAWGHSYLYLDVRNLHQKDCEEVVEALTLITVIPRRCTTPIFSARIELMLSRRT